MRPRVRWIELGAKDVVVYPAVGDALKCPLKMPGPALPR